MEENMDIEVQIMVEILELKELLQDAIKEDKPYYITDLYHKMIALKNDELKLLQSVEDI